MEKTKKIKVWLCRILLAMIIMSFLAVLFTAIKASAYEEHHSFETRWDEETGDLVKDEVIAVVIRKEVARKPNPAGIPHTIPAESAMELVQGYERQISLDTYSKKVFDFPFVKSVHFQPIGITESGKWIEKDTNTGTITDILGTIFYMIFPAGFILITSRRLWCARKLFWKPIALYLTFLTASLIPENSTSSILFFAVTGILTVSMVIFFTISLLDLGLTNFVLGVIVIFLVASSQFSISESGINLNYSIYILVSCIISYLLVFLIPKYIQRFRQLQKEKQGFIEEHS